MTERRITAGARVWHPDASKSWVTSIDPINGLVLGPDGVSFIGEGLCLLLVWATEEERLAKLTETRKRADHVGEIAALQLESIRLAAELSPSGVAQARFAIALGVAVCLVGIALSLFAVWGAL